MTPRRIVLDSTRPPRTRVEPDVVRDAVFSEDRRFRYALSRQWGNPTLTRCCFIMLNPSTADAHADDPTIRRCVGFAQAWGHDALDVVNLFAFRATSPHVLRQREAVDAVGVCNDAYILDRARVADLVVCAWGEYGTFGRRDTFVTSMLRRNGIRLRHLGMTRAGFEPQPRHPLYLKRTLVPRVWNDDGSRT